MTTVELLTRNVFPQCPHTTLVPSGWTGNAGWVGCSSQMSITGPRLIMRRLWKEKASKLMNLQADWEPTWNTWSETDYSKVNELNQVLNPRPQVTESINNHSRVKQNMFFKYSSYYSISSDQWPWELLNSHFQIFITSNHKGHFFS